METDYKKRPAPYQKPPISPPHHLCMSRGILPNKLSLMEKPVISFPEYRPDDYVFFIRGPDGLWVDVVDDVIRHFIKRPDHATGMYSDLRMAPKFFPELRPAHLPTLADLKGMCPRMAQWWEEVLSSESGEGKPLVMDELLCLVDPTPQLPVFRTTYRLDRCLNLEMGTFTDSLFIGYSEPVWRPFLLSANRGWDDERDVGVVDVRPREKKAQETPMFEGQFIILAWNCRGINRPSFMVNMRHLIQFHNPHFILVSEARISKRVITKTFEELDLPYKFVYVEPVGRAGGLLMLWDPTNATFIATINTPNTICGVLQAKSDDGHVK